MGRSDSAAEPDLMQHEKDHGVFRGLFLYKENHALDAWFSEAYGDE